MVQKCSKTRTRYTPPCANYNLAINNVQTMDCSKQIYQGTVDGIVTGQDQWVIMEAKVLNDIVGDSISTSIDPKSSFEDSIVSVVSSFSSDTVDDDDDDDDATSSTPSSSSSSYGPLYELYELMEQLPIKRGLSKYYQGKCQSFASLASVKSIEDLAKKESPYMKKMKSCKSYGGGLDGRRSFSPKPTISKKASRGSSLLSSLGNRGTQAGTCRF